MRCTALHVTPIGRLRATSRRPAAAPPCLPPSRLHRSKGFLLCPLRVRRSRNSRLGFRHPLPRVRLEVWLLKAHDRTKNTRICTHLRVQQREGRCKLGLRGIEMGDVLARKSRIADISFRIRFALKTSLQRRLVKLVAKHNGIGLSDFQVIPCDRLHCLSGRLYATRPSWPCVALNGSGSMVVWRKGPTLAWGLGVSVRMSYEGLRLVCAMPTMLRLEW